MAEVSRRFVGNGIYRLIFLRTSQNHPLCPEESPGSLVIFCTSCHSPAKEDHGQVLSKIRSGLESEKLSRLREAEDQQKNVIFLPATFSHLHSSRLIYCAEPIERLQPCRSGLLISTGLLQEKLLTYSRSPWTKRVVFIHSDAFRSHQQLRTFCTALFVLTDIGSEKLSREPRHSPTLRRSTRTRGYSWRSEGASHLHRGKTTYYDVLKVSPSATQSQIKTAYYKQSFINHPDKNAGSKEATKRFSEISEAYMVLSDVNLRRRYDQAILNQSDVQGAGRPSTSSSSRFTSYQQQQRARHMYQPDGRPIYDFDSYYRAHYGEQLRREKAMRARKKQMEEIQKERYHKWKQDRMMEITFIMTMTVAGIILICIKKP